LMTSVFGAIIRGNLRERKGHLNVFYILEEQAHTKGVADNTLIIFEGRKWTYKEVYEIVLKYGTWLKTTFDIKPKEIVAIDFENSEKFIFIWFGLWSIGAKPALINYNLKDKALTHCIRVSTARLILVDPRIQANVGQDVRDALPSVQFITLTPEIESLILSTNGVREPDSVRAEGKLQDLAMLIYTSGTTGLPKPAHVSWQKCIVGGYLIHKFISYARPDIFYTVSISWPFEEFLKRY
jgi:acyl-coenzyme A synthetase/AMP-(fatty) acid ligase